MKRIYVAAALVAGLSIGGAAATLDNPVHRSYSTTITHDRNDERDRGRSAKRWANIQRLLRLVGLSDDIILPKP